MISEQERRAAMSTARNNGAVSKNAIVPKIVRNHARKGEDIILDYGCGLNKRHVTELLSEGYIVEGYDFSLPHSKVCLNATYDVVYLSNVLNVQSSLHMLDNTLREVREILRRRGTWSASVVMNYPASPRKLNLSNKAMETILKQYFHNVMRVDKSEAGNNVVWICQGANFVS